MSWKMLGRVCTGVSWTTRFAVLEPEKMPLTPLRLLPVIDWIISTSGCCRRKDSILPTLSLVTCSGVFGGFLR